jgi:hypothetical protein
MNTLIVEITNDQVELDPQISRKVLQHMYDEADSKHFEEAVNEDSHLNYSTFLKMVLDFQLTEHEKYLKGFNLLFQNLDTDNDGLVDLL